MTSQAVIQALDSSDARKRFAAVKRIARDKDESMLQTLATLAQDDPDGQVREMASRAVQYITGEARLNGADILNKSGAKVFVEEVKVSEKDKARAKAFLDNAIGYQISEEPDRALKELKKAVAANPQIEGDVVFRGVLDQITGTFGDESVAMLHDPDHIQAIKSGERRARKRQRADEHQEAVNRSSWASAAMDLSIYTFILIFATLFLPVVISQSAGSFIAGQEAAWVAYNQAVAEGAQNVVPPAPIDPDVIAFVEWGRTFGFSTGVILGLITGISGLVGMLINLFFTHISARFIFGGQATLPHLIYKVVSFYNSRIPIIYGLIYVAVVAFFLMGGGILPMLIFGAASLFSVFMSFKVIGRVGEAYDFGFLRGCLSMLIAGFIVGILSFIVQLMFYGTLAALLESTLA